MKQNDRRREFKNTKSRAGRRTIGPRDPIIKLLRKHRDAQAWERKQAGDEWEDKGCVFTQPTGPAHSECRLPALEKALDDAGVRDGRLHDARHIAGTVLLGVPDVVVDAIMAGIPAARHECAPGTWTSPVPC